MCILYIKIIHYGQNDPKAFLKPNMARKTHQNDLEITLEVLYFKYDYNPNGLLPFFFGFLSQAINGKW